MSEMVVRVAKAMTPFMGCRIDDNGNIWCCGEPCECWQAARAAIDAMREPNEVMIEAGSRARSMDYAESYLSGDEREEVRERSDAVYRAMIDAALAEE